MRFLVFIMFLSFVFSNKKNDFSYVPLENKEIYSILEYSILKKNFPGIFILNQPFTKFNSKLLIDDYHIFNVYYHNNISSHTYSKDKYSISLSPGFSWVNTEQFDKAYPTFKYIFNLSNKNIFLVTDLNIDEKYKLDKDYHGNVKLWPTGYIHNAYILYNDNWRSFFMGRQSRNWGALNEYGLLFSNNPYSFDHLGFMLTANKLKFTFFTSKLNSIYAVDLDGVAIEPGSYQLSNRFWSIHRLDYIFSNRIQMSISEAVVYGGPNSNFEFTYLNPFYFYLVAQKNEKLEANNFIQFSVLYKNNKNLSYYLDFLIDDIIVNNTGINERNVYPDRLGVNLKMTYANIRIIHSLRYVKIWDETYLSYRSYENYFINNKLIGFPHNSYEGIKYKFTSLRNLPIFYSLELELYNLVDSQIQEPFDENNLDFLAGENEKVITLTSVLSKKNKKNTYEIIFNYQRNFKSDLSKFSINVNYSYRL